MASSYIPASTSISTSTSCCCARSTKPSTANWCSGCRARTAPTPTRASNRPERCAFCSLLSVLFSYALSSRVRWRSRSRVRWRSRLPRLRRRLLRRERVIASIACQCQLALTPLFLDSAIPQWPSGGAASATLCSCALNPQRLCDTPMSSSSAVKWCERVPSAGMFPAARSPSLHTYTCIIYYLTKAAPCALRVVDSSKCRVLRVSGARADAELTHRSPAAILSDFVCRMPMPERVVTGVASAKAVRRAAAVFRVSSLAFGTDGTARGAPRSAAVLIFLRAR